MFNKQVKRKDRIHEVRQHPKAIIAMEAYGSSHHWARIFSEMGFTVKLIPAQHVKAFVGGNKNDANDALAISESALRPNLHHVLVKTLVQQDIQTLLRIRTRFKDARRINANQLKGLLAEYGLIMPIGINNIPKKLPYILEDAGSGLTNIARQAMSLFLSEHHRLTQEISTFEAQLKTIHGARTVHNWAARRDDPLIEWVKSIAVRRGKHKTTVTLANKTARMVSAVLNKGADTLPPHNLAAV